MLRRILVLLSCLALAAVGLTVGGASTGTAPAAAAPKCADVHVLFARGTVEAAPPRGEIVLLVGPPAEEVAGEADLEALLKAALETLGPGQAAAEIAKATGRPRKEVYALALKLRALADDADEDEAAP